MKIIVAIILTKWLYHNMKLSMIVQDEIGDMEITTFDKQVESMTNINLPLMNVI